MKPQIKLQDVMPVVVVLSPHGLYVVDMRGDDDRILAEFPEDIERFVTAFHRTYARGMPREWVARKFRQLLRYLELREAHLTEGDLVRIEDGKPIGAKIMPDVMEDASRIYGRDMELFLLLVFDMMRDVRRGLSKGVKT